MCFSRVRTFPKSYYRIITVAEKWEVPWLRDLKRKKKLTYKVTSTQMFSLLTVYIYIQCCLKTIFLGYPIYVWVYICIPSKQLYYSTNSTWPIARLPLCTCRILETLSSSWALFVCILNIFTWSWVPHVIYEERDPLLRPPPPSLNMGDPNIF